MATNCQPTQKHHVLAFFEMRLGNGRVSNPCRRESFFVLFQCISFARCKLMETNWNGSGFEMVTFFCDFTMHIIPFQSELIQNRGNGLKCNMKNFWTVIGEF